MKRKGKLILKTEKFMIKMEKDDDDKREDAVTNLWDGRNESKK